MSPTESGASVRVAPSDAQVHDHGPAETAHSSRPAPSQAHIEPPTRLAFTQIAFAGHNRSEDLGDPAHVSVALDTAFETLIRAGLREAQLVTGVAVGADLLAAEAWKKAELGPIHAVLPYIDDPIDPRAQALVQSSTWLNGLATEALGRNAHLAQTRWLIGAADLLVVVWTGDSARGAGGTADAVRLALEHAIPVLWIKPDAPCVLRLIRPEHLDEDFGFLEFLEELRFGREPLVRDATPESLHAALADLGLTEFPEALQDQATDDELASTRRWGFLDITRTYAVFRKVLGGRAPRYDATPAPPDLLAQPGFALLREAQAIADAQASRLGAIHRSHQVILLSVAILAAMAGSASAIWPDTKLIMAVLELSLAVGAWRVWKDSEKGARHHRWGNARRLAEDLRLERVAWVLGVSTVPHGAHQASGRHARERRRRAGLPSGTYDTGRVRAWGAWAIDELIAGQAAYHRAQSTINGRVSHRVHQFENVSFAVLLVLLVAYVLGGSAMIAVGAEVPHWLGGLVAAAGTIVPAIGAAGLALEATLSLDEQAQRSRVLAERLELLNIDVPNVSGLEPLQWAAKGAIRLQRAQENHWTEGAIRRKLFRGG